jgi:hypothetical protein
LVDEQRLRLDRVFPAFLREHPLELAVLASVDRIEHAFGLAAGRECAASCHAGIGAIADDGSALARWALGRLDAKLRRACVTATGEVLLRAFPGDLVASVEGAEPSVRLAVGVVPTAVLYRFSLADSPYALVGSGTQDFVVAGETLHVRDAGALARGWIARIFRADVSILTVFGSGDAFAGVVARIVRARVSVVAQTRLRAWTRPVAGVVLEVGVKSLPADVECLGIVRIARWHMAELDLFLVALGACTRSPQPEYGSDEQAGGAGGPVSMSHGDPLPADPEESVTARAQMFAMRFIFSPSGGRCLGWRRMH